METWEIDCECRACKGTGLYVGLAERDGSAVVCHRCKGSGREHITVNYTPFTKRVARKNVVRVFETNPGICIGSGNGHSLEDFGGIPYEDWVAGKSFGLGTENREYTCPAWFYQSADYKKKPNWDTCRGFGSFSACKHFSDKASCWKRFDGEQS